MSKRLLLSIASVAALSALVTGASFALFTASTTNQQNTFTAGTVTLGQVTGFSCGVSANNMAPGDSGSCNVSVTYTGSLDAWIGVNASSSGALFGGATPMTFTLSGGTGTVGGKYVIGQVSTGDTAAVSVAYNFPLAADNSYQGATGTIDLSFHAVQAAHNTNGTNDGPIAWN